MQEKASHLLESWLQRSHRLSIHGIDRLLFPSIKDMRQPLVVQGKPPDLQPQINITLTSSVFRVLIYVNRIAYSAPHDWEAAEKAGIYRLAAVCTALGYLRFSARLAYKWRFLLDRVGRHGFLV